MQIKAGRGARNAQIEKNREGMAENEIRRPCVVEAPVVKGPTEEMLAVRKAVVYARQPGMPKELAMSPEVSERVRVSQQYIQMWGLRIPGGVTILRVDTDEACGYEDFTGVWFTAMPAPLWNLEPGLLWWEFYVWYVDDRRPLHTTPERAAVCFCAAWEKWVKERGL